MCECIKTPHLIAGWICCGCRAYSGLQRKACKQCDRPRCAPLLADQVTGHHFETYPDAYADDPLMLATIIRQLSRSP